MRAIVTINIKYDDATVSSEKNVKEALRFAVRHLANNGMLSDEECVVDEWSYTLELSHTGGTHG